MSNINRDYLIVLNPKTSKVTVPELNYYIYDKYTANLFVNLVTVENGKIVNMADADQYKLVLHVLKPTNEIQTVEDIQVFNKEKALFQIELDQELTKNIGRYKCELLTIDKTDHVVQSAKFSYRVKKSIYNDLDVVTETPQYPIIITLLDKLQDIDKYEEERRANEVARVAAEKARVKDYTDLRQTVTTDIDTMQEKIDSFDGKVQEVDNAVQQMRTNITNYQAEKNKELDSYKTQKDTQINTSIKNMENTIDTYKTEKDKQINDKITQQDTKIDKAIDLQNKNIQASTKALNDKLDAAVQDQNNTIAANNQAQNKVISDAVAAQNKTINTVVESDKVQNDRLDTLETNDTNNKAEIKKLQDKDVEHEERMTAIEAVNVEQNNRLDAIEIKNDQQDSRLNDVEAKNKKQDLDLKCLFAESHSERITLEDEVGNSVFLQNSKQGFATVDELKGNTLVNCNKDTDKELILNGNIDTSGYGTVTTTEGVDGGKVDVALEGNTMVNVCEQEDPIAITKNYEVTTGNHVALQGEYDGKCRPVLNGNTLVNLMDFEKNATEFGGNVSYENGIITLTETEYWSSFAIKLPLKTSTIYTLVINIIENTTGSRIYVNNVNEDKSYFENFAWYSTEEMGISKFVVTTKADITDKVYSIRTDGVDKNGNYAKIQIMILEGDYTNKPIPNYFTGLQSSFEDNYVPENLYKFSSRDDFYLLNNNAILDGEYIKMTANSAYQNAMLKPLDTIKPSTTYTIVVDVVENTLDSMLYITNNSDDAQLAKQNIQVDSGKTGIFTYAVTTRNDLSGCTRCLVNYLDNTNTTGSIKYRIKIVEGDYTNYDFTNYDSSKGGKYKVDYKVTGKNKCHIKDGNYTNNVNTNGLTWTIKNNQIQIDGTSTGMSSLGVSMCYPNFINGKTYVTSTSNSNVTFYISYNDNGTINYSGGGNKTYTHNSNYTDIRCYLQVNSDNVTFNNEIIKCQIEEGTEATTYEPYKEYTKTFYLNSPLLEGDTIEDVNGKATHVHRYNTITFDGSDDERWAMKQDDWELPNSIVFATVFPNGKGYIWKTYTGEESVSDKIPSYGDDYLRTNDVFGYTNDNISAKKYFRIPKSYLSTQDVAGFRKYLQQNPATVVYELAKPTYETISNDSILCDSYVNGHLDVDSVVPIDKVVFQSYGTSLKYLSPNTEYIIQFESDSNGKLDALALNSSDVIGNLNIVKGINKFNITTSDKITINYLWTTGIGFNMSKVVVTPKVEQTFGYFKGMKSVGQDDENGHKIEILSRNKNLLDNLISYPIEVTKGAENDGVLVGIIKVKPNTTYTISAKRDRIAGRIIAKMSNKLLVPSDLPLGIFSQSYIYNFLKENYANGRKFEYSLYAEDSIKFTTLNDCNYLYINIDGAYQLNIGDKFIINNVQIEEGEVATTYQEHKSNKKEILLNEPLRSLPNGVKDKIVLIDGKWYIERNCMAVQFKDLKYDRTDTYQKAEFPDVIGFRLMNTGINAPILCDRFAYTNDRIINFGELLTNKEAINITSSNTMDEFFITIQKTKLQTLDFKGLMKYFTDNPMEIITKATTTTYEPIEYNSFEVYSNTTHISNNSNIPCNMVIRNSGFNCMLKPNTTYTVSSNNGLSSVVTKASIGDSVLRFYDKDTTSVTKMSNVLVLEGDYITGNPPIPAFFKGMESTFEQELVTDEQDKNYGKYKVNVKATNPDNKQENNITFYIKEPLRGVGDVKDKVYVKEDKVVVERNCKEVVLNGSEDGWVLTKDNGNSITFRLHNDLVCDACINSLCISNLFIHDKTGGLIKADNSMRITEYSGKQRLFLVPTKNKCSDLQSFKQWLQANPITVVYQLTTPIYEEVEYFDLKLFVEIFKDTTIIYNSNIPVTSTINYTYSTPLTDAVNTVSDISDQQDSMIIDMATQVATMEMMLM